MTPEEKTQFEQMQNTLNQVVEFINKLDSTVTLPYDFGNAVAGRIVNSSTKGASSESQSVNEGGSAQYTVLKNPDGYITVNVGGAFRNVPYFD